MTTEKNQALKKYPISQYTKPTMPIKPKTNEVKNDPNIRGPLWGLEVVEGFFLAVDVFLHELFDNVILGVELLDGGFEVFNAVA